MNRFKNIFCCTIIFTIVGFLCGCEEELFYDEFYTLETDQKRFEVIEPLEMERFIPEDDKQEPNSIYQVSQEPNELVLTIQRCRILSLTNNLEIKAELLSPEISAQSVNVERAKFEATLYSNVNFYKTDTPTATTLEGNSVENTRLNTGVRMPLETGGTLTFDLGDSRTKTDNVFSTLNPSFNTDFSISISQPLLKNAGIQTSNHSIRIAEYSDKITQSRTKLEVMKIIAAVDRVYWRLFASRKELEVRKRQYDLAQMQLEQAKRFFDAGERAKIEVVRAEAGVAERLEAIIIAENALRDRQRELKRVLNKEQLSMQSATTLIPTTEPNPIRYDLDRNMLIEMAIDNRMELLELQLQLASDISNIDYNRNQLLPLFNIDYTYNINGLGPSREDAYDLLEDRRFEDQRVGLSLVIPLGNQAAKSRLRQSIYQRQQRLLTKQNRERLIKYEVLTVLDRLEANWQRILAARQNAILSGNLYQQERRRFEQGLSTSTDVLDAQTKFEDAQNREIAALTEYQISQVDLAYATGTLLGSADIIIGM